MSTLEKALEARMLKQLEKSGELDAIIAEAMPEFRKQVKAALKEQMQDAVTEAISDVLYSGKVQAAVAKIVHDLILTSLKQ